VRPKMNANHRRRDLGGDSAGWTLIQCMLAMAVLATLSVVLMNLLGQSADLTRLSGETDLATAIAQSQLETLRALDPSDIGTGENRPPLVGEEAVRLLPFGAAATDLIPEEEGLLRVRSKVSWGPKSRRRTVTLETFIAVPGGHGAN